MACGSSVKSHSGLLIVVTTIKTNKQTYKLTQLQLYGHCQNMYTTGSNTGLFCAAKYLWTKEALKC